jgi:hypothetical protein
MADAKKPMGWAKVVIIVLGAALLTGMALAALANLLGLEGGVRTAGVGAGTGVVAVFLLNRLRRH